MFILTLTLKGRLYEQSPPARAKMQNLEFTIYQNYDRNRKN